jgi:hypothetical protein
MPPAQLLECVMHLLRRRLCLNHLVVQHLLRQQVLLLLQQQEL